MENNVLTGFVFGAGFMGKTHVNAYLNDKRVRIIGIVDTDEKKGSDLAKLAGCKWFASAEEAYSFQKADFADVCLPSFLHKEAVISCLEKGSDVIVEKPFAVDIADAQEMLDSAVRLKRRLTVAHVCRFMPQYFETKRIIDSGKLGKPISLYACRESEPPAWSWNNWFKDKGLSGGTLLDLSIHDLDISNWFFGEPKQFRAVVSSTEKDSGFNYVSSSLVYEKGYQSTIIASHLMPVKYPFVSSFRLVLEKGCIEWNTGVFGAGILGVTDSDSTELIDVAEKYPFETADPYAAELKDFVSSLISGNDFRVPPEEALLAVQTVYSLYANSLKI